MESEERLRCYATFTLHEPVGDVLRKLGVNGEFALTDGYDVAILGEPDFAWITSNGQRHSKRIVRVPAAPSLLVTKPRRRRFRGRLKGGVGLMPAGRAGFCNAS